MWAEGLAAGTPPELHAKVGPVLEVGPRSLEVAREAGVAMACGTDPIGPLRRHRSREPAIRADGLGPLEAIRSATIEAARLFRLKGEVGEVAVGAHADLLAVDGGDPLAELGLLQGQGEGLALILKHGAVVKDALDATPRRAAA